MSKQQPIVKVFNHRARDAQFMVEFEGKRTRYPMKADTDAELDAAAKRAGVWKKGGEYPGFTIYKDGEEIGGGGGSNSGSMDRARDRSPRVRVFSHYKAKDGIDNYVRSPGGAFFMGTDAGGNWIVGGVRQKDGPGMQQEFGKDKARALEHFHWLIKEYD